MEQSPAEGIGEQVRFLRFGKLRYENQEHSVEVPLPDGAVDEARSQIADSFHGSYEREYTYRLDAPVEFVGAHIVAIAEVGQARAHAAAGDRAVGSATRSKAGARSTTRPKACTRRDIYAGELLEPGMSFDGPADRRDEGQHGRRPPRKRGRVDELRQPHHHARRRRRERDAVERTTDPITLEIIQNSLQAISDEMFAAMRKTAMSAIIYEVLDMGTGITDGDGRPRLVGRRHSRLRRRARQGREADRRAERPDEIRPGDIFVTNDPFYGGVTHLNDVVLAMPVFAGRRARRLDGEHRALERRRRDGAGLDLERGDARSSRRGCGCRPMKLISEGEPIRSVMEIMKVNSRLPDFLQGDMWAGIAAARVGERRIVELVEKYGVETFGAALRASWTTASRSRCARSPTLPKGTFALAEEQDDGASTA